ncbi:MAG: hypothetical protein LBD59_05010 [Prevotellaceae bacterium]|jgi:hypothetical protein|nr:hypothetical protein [Prevotellaceae bacterium]
MKQKYKRPLLYSGLTFMLLSFTGKWILNMPNIMFYIFLGIAITCKTLFLLSVIRANGFKLDVGLYFILTGVGLMLISMLFKTIIPIPVLQQILFYTAILLKVTGIILKFK